MFAPLVRCAGGLSTLTEWPSREVLQRLVSERDVTNARGAPLRLVAPGCGPYEMIIHEEAQMQVREREWHDLFNVLVWLAYPRAKAALNERHVCARMHELAARIEPPLRQTNRGRVRDALTLFDESGAIVVSADGQLLDDLRAHRWKALFWEERERVLASMRFYLFGHALFAKALNPYIGMTAHAITLLVDSADLPEPGAIATEHLDATVAACVRDAAQFHSPRTLTPLPVLGVPGWSVENEQESFYDNERYFRRARTG